MIVEEKIEYELEHGIGTLADLDKLVRTWRSLSATAKELSAAQNNTTKTFYEAHCLIAGC